MRLFVITASDAAVAAVLRRGPSDWWHIGRWSLDVPDYEPGAWFRGALYPQKCDLSPDGRWLAYSALQANATWAAGTVYEAVSRLPWLEALAAWEEGTTYTRGAHFDDATSGKCDLGEPDVGDVAPISRRFGMAITRPVQFAVERRRGWTEAAGTAARETGGPWDEDREVVMEKARPGEIDPSTLAVEGSFAAFRSLPDLRTPAVYSLRTDEDLAVLDGVQWADWAADGRLLVATDSGALEVRRVDGLTVEVEWSHDLSQLGPDPAPAPSWASRH